MVKQMKEETIEFLRNRTWDLSEGATVPKEIDEWAVREGFGDGEEGYLVHYNGQYGYLYDEEYAHDEQSNGFDKEFALEHHLINKEVLKVLNEKAEKLSAVIDNSIVVMIGEKTGFMECHEFCIFFPFGTDKKMYKQTLDTFHQIGEKVA